jgi:hypothetical protein
MIKNFLLIITTAILTLTLKAQKKPMPVTISVFYEATAIPFTKFITTPVHPDVQVGSIVWAVNGNYDKIDRIVSSKKAMEKIFDAVF